MGPVLRGRGGAAVRAVAEALAEYVRKADAETLRGDLGPGAVRRGIEYAGERRDWTWAILKAYEIRLRELEDPTRGGFPLETPDRSDATPLLAERHWLGVPWGFGAYASRAKFGAALQHPEWYVEFGEYRSCLSANRDLAVSAERRGRLGRAATLWANTARMHIALGEFAEAEGTRRRAAALAGRLTEPSIGLAAFTDLEDDRRLAMDEEWDAPIDQPGPGIGEGQARKWYWSNPAVGAAIARTHARMGRVERAMRRLASVVPIIEQAPAGARDYTHMACDAAETLWLTERTDRIEVIEHNLRAKVVEPDFRWPMMDGRLAMARLCALQGRHDEAGDWFAKARTVLDEQGARPLRAIVDYDEALMYARRDEPGDAERARPLLDAALAQFRSLGMRGWIRRAEALHGRL